MAFLRHCPSFERQGLELTSLANRLVGWLLSSKPWDPPVSVFLYVYCVDGTQVLRLAWQTL